MSRRVFRRAALATAAAAALTAATALPGNAATTAEWRLSAYESAVTGSMTSVVAISRTDAWAVGNTSRGETAVNNPYVLHWNGAKWSGVTIPGGNGFTSALVSASSASNVWVLGTNFDGLLNQKIFRYDGSHWHTISVPAASSLDTLVVLSATDAWVTGQVSCAGAKCVTEVWQWNGSTWLSHPINSTVFNIAGSSATNVWAVGLSDVNQKGEGVVAAYRWAGTHWTPVAMSHPAMSGWPDIAIGSASNTWIEGWRELAHRCWRCTGREASGSRCSRRPAAPPARTLCPTGQLVCGWDRGRPGPVVAGSAPWSSICPSLAAMCRISSRSPALPAPTGARPA